jgi:2-aminobenzoate-CoA ligase
VPDETRGHIVQAHVVLANGVVPGPEAAKRLQDHVKATIAPYKFPRSVVFTEALPKTATGKVQRFALRAGGGGAAA